MLLVKKTCKVGQKYVKLLLAKKYVNRCWSGKHKKGGKWKIIPKRERKIHQLFQKGKNVEKNHTVRELSSFSSIIISCSILLLYNLFNIFPFWNN